MRWCMFLYSSSATTLPWGIVKGTEFWSAAWQFWTLPCQIVDAIIPAANVLIDSKTAQIGRWYVSDIHRSVSGDKFVAEKDCLLVVDPYTYRPKCPKANTVYHQMTLSGRKLFSFSRLLSTYKKLPCSFLHPYSKGHTEKMEQNNRKFRHLHRASETLYQLPTKPWDLLHAYCHDHQAGVMCA